MTRRQFITVLTGAAVAWPLTARAQQPAAQIGFLVSGSPNSFAIFVDAFNQGMLDNELVEGRDYQLDLRFADGDYNRFDSIAAEVAGRTLRPLSSQLLGRRKRRNVQPRLSR